MIKPKDDVAGAQANKVRGPMTLLKLVERQPILEVNASKAGVGDITLSEKDSVYFGTGICSHLELSRGVPFDALSMILTAASLRKKLGLKEIYHNIADSHALTNNFPAQEVERMAKHYEEVVAVIREVLRISDYNILRASAFNVNGEYKDILAGVESNINLARLHTYARQEIADVEFFRRKGANLKVGWTMNIKDSQYDEAFYDRNFREHMSTEVAFVYTSPGKSFDRNKQRVAPYVDFNPDKRILIPDPDALKKIDAAQKELGPDLMNGIKRYLINIFKLWREFDEGIPMNYDLKESVGYILDKLKEVKR